jgi:hypothetical protein
MLNVNSILMSAFVFVTLTLDSCSKSPYKVQIINIENKNRG